MAPLEDLSRRQLVENDFRFEKANESERERCQPVDRISRERGFQLSFDNAMTSR
ncbi:MAG: hypothetical protein ACTS5P_02325 [Candidatus Hodgkinia cicadicola]